MKNTLLIVMLLISIIGIGQKNNFFGESGKQYYKLKIDKDKYDLLPIKDGTILFYNGIQGNCFYNNGIMTIKDLYYPIKEELRFQNDYKKQDGLNNILNKQILLDIENSKLLNKLKIMLKPNIGYSKTEMKKIYFVSEVYREASNFIWFTNGIILNFDMDGGFTNVDYKIIQKANQ